MPGLGDWLGHARLSVRVCLVVGAGVVGGVGSAQGEEQVPAGLVCPAVGGEAAPGAVAPSGRICFGNAGALDRRVDELEPWLGPGRSRQLDGADFYEALRRPDLAERYRARYRTRFGLLFAGLAAVAAGFAVYLGGTLSGHATPAYAAVGGGLAGAGGLMALGSLLVGPQPISTNEAVDLVRQHNGEGRDRATRMSTLSYHLSWAF